MHGVVCMKLCVLAQVGRLGVEASLLIHQYLKCSVPLDI